MTELPLELIELEEKNFHLLLEGKLGDGEKIYWIVDTGASKTVFDTNLEKHYELVKTGKNEEFQSAGIGAGMVETQVGCIKKLKFGKLKLKDLRVALIDLSHVNSIYRKYSNLHVAGLLGSDILNDYGCQIDFQTRKITFHKKR